MADLVAAGAMGFRDFTCRHPALFRLAFGHLGLPAASADITSAAEAALQHLLGRVRRVQEIGGLGDRGLEQATLQFDALCEGLAACDLRRQLPPSLWNDALTALVRGWAATN